MVTLQSDADLVVKILGGDEDAFSQLYDAYHPRVYATVYRIVQDMAEAQDATQEIFIKLYRSLSDWDSRKAKFSTWLYRLAVNHAIDCWRSRQRRPQSSQDWAPDREMLPERELGEAILTPFSALAKKEGFDHIRRCVAELPELQKKVFLLRYFHEMKLQEIADMEDCSLGTIKTSLFRATRAVRRAVRRTGGNR